MQRNNTPSKHTSNWENTSTATAVFPLKDNKTTIYPLQDRSVTILPLQGHITIQSIDLKNMFPNSFGKIGNMPGKYAITLNLNVPLVHYGRQRATIEAKEEIEAQLKKITVQDIGTCKVEPTHWESSLGYLCKSNRTFRVCLNDEALNKAIIVEHHKVSTSEEITYKLAGSTTYSKLDAKTVFVHTPNMQKLPASYI